MVKAGFVVGGTGGSGALRCPGRTYPISIGGLSYGFMIGASETRFTGTATFTYYPRVSILSGQFADPELDRLLVAADLRAETPDELLAEALRGESVVAPLRTVSDVIREHAVARIDLLKVDVEKSEMEVLAGLADDDWGKIEQAVLEVHDLGDRLREVSTLFRAHGFGVTLEQEELYRGSDRWNVYALRDHIGTPETPESPAADHTALRRPDRASAVSRAEERARKLRESMRRGR